MPHLQSQTFYFYFWLLLITHSNLNCLKWILKSTLLTTLFHRAILDPHRSLMWHQDLLIPLPKLKSILSIFLGISWEVIFSDFTWKHECLLSLQHIFLYKGVFYICYVSQCVSPPGLCSPYLFLILFVSSASYMGGNKSLRPGISSHSAWVLFLCLPVTSCEFLATSLGHSGLQLHYL